MRVGWPRLGSEAVVVKGLVVGAAAQQRAARSAPASVCKVSVASLRPTPGGASSARYPAGARPLARLSFAYFSLARQRKVSRPSRPKPDFGSSEFAIGRAEQRSGGRIRAGACLSVASLRPTPDGASSARYPAGARPLARLFFGYFLLAKQKKVTWPTGRNRYSKLTISKTRLML